MARINKKIKKAMEKAEREARKQSPKPKKRVIKKDVARNESPTSKWIKDSQGEVFFDGYYYWTTEILPTGNVTSDSWTQEEWNERSKGKLVFNVEFGCKILMEEIDDFSRRNLERRPNYGTTRHKQKSIEPSNKRGKTTNRKTRKQQSIPRRKSVEVVKKQGN